METFRACILNAKKNRANNFEIFLNFYKTSILNASCKISFYFTELLSLIRFNLTLYTHNIGRVSIQNTFLSIDIFKF